MLQTSLIPIQPGVWYTVREIIAHGWIRNTLRQADRHYVYRLITTGKLKAQNRSTNPRKPIFYVRGSSLLAYLGR
jgi:hypothetical protein